VVERRAKLMQNYIDRGRSTPDAFQKNEFNLSLSFRNGQSNKKTKKDKLERKNPLAVPAQPARN
jgi:hypothetical protein